MRRKIVFIAVLIVIVFQMNILEVNAGGGYTSDGNELTYRVNLIEIEDEVLHVYGYAYENNGEFDYVQKGTTIGQHCYQLIVNGVTYKDQGDYYIDHSILNSYTTSGYTLYKDVGFHFEIPLDDLVDTVAMTYSLTLRIYHHNRSWATIDLSYMAPMETIIEDGYTIEFNTSSINTLLYTSFDNVFVRESPSKTGMVVQNSKGYNLYYSPNDIYSISEGSMTGQTYYDSVNKVYWYEVIYQEDGYSNGKYRVVASDTGKKSWISDTFLKYASDPIEIKVSRNTYNITYNVMGGDNCPSNQNKWHGYDLNLASDAPLRTGYTFIGWNTRSDGKGTYYQPGDIYTKDENLYLYAIWDNTYPVISGPMMDIETQVTSGIEPFLDATTFVMQLGDQINFLDYFEAYDKEDGDITKSLSLSSCTVPLDSNGVTITEGTFSITVKAQDLAEYCSYYKMEVIVNGAPSLEVQERWFLSSSVVTKTDVLSKLLATDLHDGNIESKVVITQVTYPDGTTDLNPTVIDTTISEETTEQIEVVYYVEDNYKQSTTSIGYIYIYPDSALSVNTQTIRFISSDYSWTLSEESIWNIKEYQDLLTLSYQETNNQTYYFTKDCINEIKDWIITTNPSTIENQNFSNNYLEVYKQ